MGGVPRYPLETVARARGLSAQGKSLREIARLLGVPKSTLHDWLGGEGRRLVRQCRMCGTEFEVDGMSYDANRQTCSDRCAHYLKRTTQARLGRKYRARQKAERAA